MATKRIAASAAEAPEAADSKMVQLKCDKLGVESQDFTPAHAKALLDFQQAKGLQPEDCWQPIDAADTTTDNA